MIGKILAFNFSILNNQCITFNYSGKTKLVDILCKLSNRFCNIDTIDDSVTGSFQQVDLNRHLEEIAQKVETYLVCHQQNWLLNKNKSNASHFIKLLKEWESFVESSHCYQCGEFQNTFFSIYSKIILYFLISKLFLVSVTASLNFSNFLLLILPIHAQFSFYRQAK